MNDPDRSGSSTGLAASSSAGSPASQPACPAVSQPPRQPPGQPASETVAAATLAALPFGVLVYDSQLRIAYVNDAAWRLNRLQPGELPLGAPLRDLVRLCAYRGVYGAGDPEAQAARYFGIDRSRKFHRMLRGADGTCLDLHGIPLADGGFCAVLAEVTVHFAAAEAATAQARRLESVLAQLQGGIAIFDAAGRVALSNPAYDALSGLPRGAISPGMHQSEVLRAMADQGEFANLDAEARIAERRAVDRSRPQTYQRERPNGQVVSHGSQPMPDGGWLVEITDITAAQRAEDEARRRAALLDGVLAAMPHGVVVFDADQHVAMLNAAYQSILAGAPIAVGEHRAEIVRRREAAGEYGAGDAAALIRQNLPDFEDRRGGRQRQRPDGRMIDIRHATLPDGGRVQVTTDITALHQARAEATERARLSQLMLDTMRHGIALFGQDRRVIAANALAASIGGIPAAAMTPGTTLERLVEIHLRSGMLGPAAEATERAAEIIGFDRSRPSRYQRIVPDGRIVEVTSDPTPGGGFVVTWSDVTIRAQAEAAARHRAHMLQSMLDNTRHGIVLYGVDRRVLVANTLAADLGNLAPDDLRPGQELDAVLRRQQASGVYGQGEAAAAEAARLIGLDRRLPHRLQRTLPDHRIVEIASDPTPDGGFVVTWTDITARARAEAEAEARAAVLQSTMDSVRHAIVMYGPDRRLVTANRLAGPEYGLPPLEGQVGQPFAALVEQQLAAGAFGSGAEARQRAATVLGIDRSRPVRYEHRLRSGRVVAVASDPTADGGFVITHSDVTELAEARASASERAAILQVMLDNMRHGICYYGADRRVIAANALAVELGGQSPGTLVPGRSLDALIADQVAVCAGNGRDVTALAETALRMDRSRPARYVRASNDGRIVEVTSDPTPGGGFVVTMADITPLAEAEAEAQHRAGIQQAMLDNIRHGIALFDAEDRVVAVNTVFRQLLGLPEAVLAPGRPYADFVAELRDRGEYGTGEQGELAAAAILGRDRRDAVRTIRTRPNGQVLDVVSDPTPGGGWVLTYTDVTEDRRVRAELEGARETAEGANRAKSRFLATMSHELRTPLNAVIGFSEAIMADPDPVRGLDYVKSIHEAGRHLLALIDDLLDVARSETTGFAVTEGEVDIVALAEAAERVMRAAAAAAQVSVETALLRPLPLVRADPVRLRQVLLNLLSNAVKFTPAGGTVRVDAILEPAGDLVLRVTDSGIGMSAADIPRAFEPFIQLDSTLSRRFQGSGLGLYLSRALAEAQGAVLTLQSAPGAGTTAMLRIPAERLLPPVAA